jgi:hypothetical protein
MDDGVHGGPVRHGESRGRHRRAGSTPSGAAHRPHPSGSNGSEEHLVIRGPEPLDPRPGPAEEALPPAREQLPLPRRRRQAHIEPQLRERGGAGDGTPFSAFSAFSPSPTAPPAPPARSFAEPAATGGPPAPRAAGEPVDLFGTGRADATAPGIATPTGDTAVPQPNPLGPPNPQPQSQPQPQPQPRPERPADRAAAFRAATRRGRRRGQRPRSARG